MEDEYISPSLLFPCLKFVRSVYKSVVIKKQSRVYTSHNYFTSRRSAHVILCYCAAFTAQLAGRLVPCPQVSRLNTTLYSACAQPAFCTYMRKHREKGGFTYISHTHNGYFRSGIGNLFTLVGRTRLLNL
jgi:hypothetical protein